MNWRKLWNMIFPDWEGSWTETVDVSIDALECVKSLSQTLATNRNSSQIQPYVEGISSLLEFIDSPWGEVMGEGIPFLRIGTKIVRLLHERSNDDKVFQEGVLTICQAAYLESLSEVIKSLETTQGKDSLFTYFLERPASGQLRHIRNWDLNFSRRDAEDALKHFASSKLAATFNEVLSSRLQEAIFELLKERHPESEEQSCRRRSNSEAKKYADYVARNTHRLIWWAIANNTDDPITSISNYLNNDLRYYDSVDLYLREQIAYETATETIRRQWAVFRETFSIKDIFVHPYARVVNKYGDTYGEPIELQDWVLSHLQDPGMQDQVIFIEAVPGRGKSAFCQIFSDWVQAHQRWSWIPTLIRLQHVTQNDLRLGIDEFLQQHINGGFTREDIWLTDRNTRYLFILDGFDDLLMKSSISDVESFMAKISRFQEICSESSEKEHRFIVTGRTLAIELIEKTLPSNIKRIRIEPFTEEQQHTWLDKWEKQNISQRACDFSNRLMSRNIPAEVRRLAQEPLFLYLLAAMYRDDELSSSIFSNQARNANKIQIYEHCITWTLDQRGTVLPEEDQYSEGANSQEEQRLKEERSAMFDILTEFGLCCSQSGNGYAPISVVSKRLQGFSTHNILDRIESNLEENDALRTVLLSSFVKKSSFNKQNTDNQNYSVEFTHKTFYEYLYSRKLTNKMQDWLNKSTASLTYVKDDDALAQDIYDLLGHAPLSQEVIDYTFAILLEKFGANQGQLLNLYHRLYTFYESWSDGHFIELTDTERRDALSKSRELSTLGSRVGQRQVDIYAGLNVIVLLLELFHFSENSKCTLTQEDKNRMRLHLCDRKVGNKTLIDKTVLRKIINYTESIGSLTFVRVVGKYLRNIHLTNSDLSFVDLSGADLSYADLSSSELKRSDLSKTKLVKANLSRAYLRGSDLEGSDLTEANLEYTDLRRAFLRGARLDQADLSMTDLTGAYLHNASLDGASFSNATLSGSDFARVSWEGVIWLGARGLETIENIPASLTNSPEFINAMKLSRGIAALINGDAQAGIEAYNSAQKVTSAPRLKASLYNRLCWLGCLYGHHAHSEIVRAGEKAIETGRDDERQIGNYHETLGLVKILNNRLEEAQENFSFVKGSIFFRSLQSKQKEIRERWFAAIDRGVDPFTEEVLRYLRANES